MNKLCIPLVLVLLAMVFVSGCLGPNTVETSQERSWRIAQGWKLDGLMLSDDWDYIMLINKNSTLSQYHQRLGY
ncbi:MAG: hypothetical protein H8E53_01015 [Planctomycetes bacterium]|nr:hypothetical protein [Planctomycetota bacterium]